MERFDLRGARGPDWADGLPCAARALGSAAFGRDPGEVCEWEIHSTMVRGLVETRPKKSWLRVAAKVSVQIPNLRTAGVPPAVRRLGYGLEVARFWPNPPPRQQVQPRPKLDAPRTDHPTVGTVFRRRLSKPPSPNTGRAVRRSTTGIGAGTAETVVVPNTWISLLTLP
jgi:hypothetical protein